MRKLQAKGTRRVYTANTERATAMKTMINRGKQMRAIRKAREEKAGQPGKPQDESTKTAKEKQPAAPAPEGSAPMDVDDVTAYKAAQSTHDAEDKGSADENGSPDHESGDPADTLSTPPLTD